MPTPKTSRQTAAEYGDLRHSASDAGDRRKYGDLEHSFGQMADNEEWVARHRDHLVDGAKVKQDAEPVTQPEAALAQQEEHMLRCLGAAVVLRWDQLPTDVQKGLFDLAGSVGPLSDARELRSRIARFLHDQGKPA